ncbi:hypothetical protein C8K36_105236 [Rhodococcus sp. OK519]|uniref:peptidoglycan-binding protein n=1 Tax=Rhodococcus sp. OK519 TaxID=2135729 RepID=UPI000D3B6D3E|nr:hypothetical protein C8K36_105236 [Rhodococcus sp. OK519]
MGTALSEQRAARSFVGATSGRAVYVKADRAGIEYGCRSVQRTVGVVGVVGAVGAFDAVGARERGRRRSVSGPTSGEVRYGTAPRHASAGVQVSRAHAPSHGRGRARSGLSAVVATFVITAGIVAGLDAIANLRLAQTDSGPVATESVEVRTDESQGRVTAPVDPAAPAAHVLDRIVELNALSRADVSAAQK